MINRKVAMIGLWGVGKTSLVRQFVTQQFNHSYLTTLGVKIDKKTVSTAGQSVNMVLWDIAGAENTFSVPMHYVKGAAGFVLVIDGTRKQSLDAAQELVASITAEVGDLPFVVAVNKADLEWKLTAADIELAGLGNDWLATSAKTGEGVEQMFQRLANHLIQA